MSDDETAPATRVLSPGELHYLEVALEIINNSLESIHPMDVSFQDRELFDWHIGKAQEMEGEIRGILAGTFEPASEEPVWLNDEERQRFGY